MPAWAVWLVVAAVFAAAEVATLGLVLAPVALAALVAALLAAVGVPLAAQIAAFAVCSLASLAFLRPVARRHLMTPHRVRTGAAALVGAEAVVLERVDRDHGTVKLRGEVWSARAFDGRQVIEPGARVHVIEINGATALVAE